MIVVDNMPPLPAPANEADSDGCTYACPEGFTADQMHAYARQHAAAEVAAVAGPLVAEAAKWRDLYRRAINEANGLTNYVEDRPELRRAERNLTAIEAEARAMVLAAPKEPAHG